MLSRYYNEDVRRRPHSSDLEPHGTPPMVHHHRWFHGSPWFACYHDIEKHCSKPSGCWAERLLVVRCYSRGYELSLLNISNSWTFPISTSARIYCNPTSLHVRSTATLCLTMVYSITVHSVRLYHLWELMLLVCALDWFNTCRDSRLLRTCGVSYDLKRYDK